MRVCISRWIFLDIQKPKDYQKYDQFVVNRCLIKMERSSMLHSSFSPDGCCLEHVGTWYVAFLACGFENGFSVYRCHPFKKLYSRSSLARGSFIVAFQKGGIGLIELLDHSNIVAMVGGGKKPLFSPNTVSSSHSAHCEVMIWDDAKARFVGEIDVNMKVLSVCIDSKRFRVCCLCYLALSSQQFKRYMSSTSAPL